MHPRLAFPTLEQKSLYTRIRLYFITFPTFWIYFHIILLEGTGGRGRGQFKFRLPRFLALYSIGPRPVKKFSKW